MNLFNASTLQRSSAEVFNAVESTGAVKIASKSRERMFLVTEGQLEKIMGSKTQRDVFLKFCQEDATNRP